MVKISTILLLCFFSICDAAIVIFENDFDNPIITNNGVTGTVSGGDQTSGAGTGSVTGGLTDGQGLNNYSDFSGDVWRVTAVDDMFIIEISNINPNETLSVDFSLAMLDSWDGTSDQYGTDIINMQVYDGGTGGTSLAGFSQSYNNSNDFTSNAYVDTVVTTSEQLGFNTADLYWNEDAYTMSIDNLQVSTGTLTFAIWGSSGGNGTGFQGGNDESFAIDNFVVTSNVPEPSGCLLLSLACLSFVLRRARTA